MNLRHRLGLEPDSDNFKCPSPERRLVIHISDGTEISDEGEEAEMNRAEWRKWIEEHKDDVFLNDDD